MSNIPDFVLQIQEVERNLKARWRVVKTGWNGAAADSFDSNVMSKFSLYIEQYITGKGITGLGVDKLLSQMDKHLEGMQQLTGMPADVAFECAAGPQHDGCVKNWFGNDIDVENDERVIERGGIVHDELRNRDYWKDDIESLRHDEEYDGVKPGELGNKEVVGILNYKKE